jgi:predicted negative regulator of RcsB-dependent stress response
LRIADAPVAYVAYLRQFFCPAGLAVMYPWQDVDLPLWKVAGACLILAAVTAAAVACRRKRPYFLVGWLWYLGMLAPVIGLVQVGEQAMADRFTYLPQIGLGVALVWGIFDGCRAWPSRRGAQAAAAACILAALAAWGWRQASFWSDSQTLWRRDLACTSLNSFAHLAYARDARTDRPDEAIEHFRSVLEIHSALPVLDRFYRADAYYGLGVVLADRGRFDEAMAEYRKALEEEPNHADAHNSLGVILLGRGRLDEAIEQFQMGLRVKPQEAAAQADLGIALAKRGRLDEAIGHFQTALELKPDDARAHTNLATALASRGRFDEAIAHYRAALALARQKNDAALAEQAAAWLRRCEARMPRGARQAPTGH